MLSQRVRIIFALLGIAIVMLSLVALAYTQLPHETRFLRETIEPTVFVPPQ